MNPHRVAIMPFRPIHRASDQFDVVGRPQTKASPYDPEVDWETYATKYLEFTDKNPTKYHAIEALKTELEAAGFKYLSERTTWDVKKGGKYYTTRNGSSFVAFVVGANWQPSFGAGLVGTHTDSLTAIVKPSSVRKEVDGYELLGIAPYAGALSDKWWDRDLGVGGRVVVKTGKKFETKLVLVPYPIAHIPSLAPHFGKPSEGPFNLETEAVPVVAQVTKPEPKPTPEEKTAPLYGKHSLKFLRLIAKYAGVKVEDIYSWDLELFDTQPASFGGIDKEFLYAPRIDDKICTYVATEALIETSDDIVESPTLTLVAGFDTEELGSLSRQGARGNLLDSVVTRILNGSDIDEKDFWANSFFCSADVTHAVNPNFDSIYLDEHKPLFNTGITLAQDPNAHMITTGVTTAFITELAKRTDNTIQQFQIRNDSRSGGTIGPYISSKTGVRGVDIGIAQWSMHSIRATVGSKDVWLGVRFFKSFYEEWSNVDLEFKLGDL